MPPPRPAIDFEIACFLFVVMCAGLLLLLMCWWGLVWLTGGLV